MLCHQPTVRVGLICLVFCRGLHDVKQTFKVMKAYKFRIFIIKYVCVQICCCRYKGAGWLIVLEANGYMAVVYLSRQ